MGAAPWRMARSVKANPALQRMEKDLLIYLCRLRVPLSSAQLKTLHEKRMALTYSGRELTAEEDLGLSRIRAIIREDQAWESMEASRERERLLTARIRQLSREEGYEVSDDEDEIYVADTGASGASLP